MPTKRDWIWRIAISLSARPSLRPGYAQFSAFDVIAEAESRDVDVSPATVRRTLRSMAALGVLRQSRDGRVRLYRLVDDEVRPSRRADIDDGREQATLDAAAGGEGR